MGGVERTFLCAHVTIAVTLSGTCKYSSPWRTGLHTHSARRGGRAAAEAEGRLPALQPQGLSAPPAGGAPGPAHTGPSVQRCGERLPQPPAYVKPLGRAPCWVRCRSKEMKNGERSIHSQRRECSRGTQSTQERTRDTLVSPLPVLLSV